MEIEYPTFAAWVEGRRGERGGYPQAKDTSLSLGITFVEAQIKKPPEQSPEGALEVASGVNLVVRTQHDMVLAAGLIRSLNQSQGCYAVSVMRSAVILFFLV